jgi:cell division GTPase FtsZ
MKLLLMGFGGGGTSVLSSIRNLIDQDISSIQATDPTFAGFLQDFLTYRYADTNSYELEKVAVAERFPLGTDGEGSGDTVEGGRAAFEQSKEAIRKLFSGYDTVFLVASLGKGTGTGSIVPACQLAREMKMLAIPVIIFPDMDTHECDKEQYDAARAQLQALDALPMRYIVINNAYGYKLGFRRRQVYKELNTTTARALRALIYAFAERRQLDRKDQATIFAGSGPIKLGYCDIDITVEGAENREEQLTEVAEWCLYERQYYDFEGEIGRGIVTILGPFTMPTIATIRKKIGEIVNGEMKSPSFRPIHVNSEFVPGLYSVAILLCSANKAKVKPLSIAWKADARDLPDKYILGDDEDIPPPTTRKRAVPQRPAKLALATATIQSALKPDKAKPVSFSQFVRALSQGSAEWKKLALEGVLADYVTLNKTDVLHEFGQSPLRTIAEEDGFSNANRKWLYDFVENHFAGIDRLMMVDNGIGKIKLTDIHDPKVLESLKPELLDSTNQALVKLLIGLAKMYDFEEVKALLSPAPTPSRSSPAVAQLKTAP